MGQIAFAFLLCLSLLAWSIAPSYSQAPTLFEPLQDHLDMVEAHGHSHGFEEDLHWAMNWAMHGHSHDVAADHDHSQAFILTGYRAVYAPAERDSWRIMRSARGPSRLFRIDRPPRA